MKWKYCEQMVCMYYLQTVSDYFKVLMLQPLTGAEVKYEIFGSGFEPDWRKYRSRTLAEHQTSGYNTQVPE